MFFFFAFIFAFWRDGCFFFLLLFLLLNILKVLGVAILDYRLIYIIVTMRAYERVYFPQMCNMKTDAMNNSDMTNTGTGPTL